MTADVSATGRAAFLAALYEGCEGLLEFRAFNGRKGNPPVGRRFCTPSDHHGIERFVTAHRNHDVYVAIATRRTASGGKLEDCLHLGALYTDVDFKVISEAEARARLARFALPPSVIVLSGGGLHVYWLLREPLDLRDPAACEETRLLLRRLATALGGDLTAAEPARVLRVPGTYNHKPEYGAPRAVVVELLEPDRRYNPSELEDMFPPESDGTRDSDAFVLPERIPAHQPGRDLTLWRYGRSLRAKGWKLPRILAALETANRERCEPPLPDDELGNVAHNVMTEANRPTFGAGRDGRQHAAAGADRPDRPEIDTANLGLDDMARSAWEAIEQANTPPRIFLYGGALAWLGPDATGPLSIQVMQLDHVRHHLADVATFIRWTRPAKDRAAEKRPAFPPIALAADLLAVPRRTLPPILRIVHAPAYTPDGRLLTTPGFDAQSGLYYEPPEGLMLPPVSDTPSADEIGKARALLCDDLLGDFPFGREADRAHAIALVLTPMLRELVAGCVPLIVVSKPTARTGAGLLTKVVSIVQTGRVSPVTTISRDEEQMKKLLTSLLIPSPGMILLDNLHGRLDSAALAAILTSPMWEDRMLGRSQILQLPVRCLFVVTGNNVVLSTEIAGRSVLIWLDAKLEDPSTRTGFRHPKLEEWTHEHRGRLLWAALTLGQAWIAAGRPLADVTLGGFEEWAATLGGVLSIAGIPKFLGNRQELVERADEERAHVRAFLADWWRARRDAQVLVNELIDLAKKHPLPIASDSEQGTLIRLGQFIKSQEDHPYDLGQGLKVVIHRAGERKRAVLWRLVGESYESDESSYPNAYAYTSDENKIKGGGQDSPHSTHSPGELLL